MIHSPTPASIAAAFVTSPAEARLPPGRKIEGLLREVDVARQRAVLVPSNSAKQIPFTWSRRTKFHRGSQEVTDAEMRNGLGVIVCWHRPLLTPPYVDKVIILSAGPRP
jgi:hypothetical protein